jgi:hypothetical protein
VIGATVFAAILLSVHLPILLSILLPVHLSICPTVFAPVSLPVFAAIRLPILLPVSPTVLLANIRLCEHHVGYDGRGCHGHDQAGNHSGFQETVLHDTSSLCVRERVDECK